MAAISNIIINGFKAFPISFNIVLEGKNLLMYGENGSGKSSIYYALHCLLQSQVDDKSSKYFRTDHQESLVNKNTLANDAFVEIQFEDSDTKYRVSKNGYQEIPFHSTSALRDLNAECVFINHKFISNFFSFRNSQYIDLFPVFIKDILPFTLTKNKAEFISHIYEDVTTGIKRKGKSNRIDDDYLKRIELFNTELSEIITIINSEEKNPNTASKIYNNYFRDSDDCNLKITLIYDNNIDNVPMPNTSYWLRLGFRFKNISKAGLQKIEIVSSRVEILDPVICLKIDEERPNGTTKPISKPQSYFNEAKLTAIALSIRLSLLDTLTPINGRFLALDDMLISLDMSNRAKVVKFLLDISNKYRIYLFTHDKAFFEFFKHKCNRHVSSKEWMYKELYMDDTRCPYLRDSKDYLGEALHYIKRHKYEIAGNFLRKEAEAFCKRFLPPKWQLSKQYTCLDLNGMIHNCRRYASESGITDLSLFDELDEYRKFILNSSSHDSYDVVKFESEVMGCLRTLQLLSNTKSETILKSGDIVSFTLMTPAPDVHKYRFDIEICDELRVIEIPGQSCVLSKVMINYYCYKDGIKGDKQSSNQTLRSFYDYNYSKSDGSENPNYLTSIKLKSNGLSISSLL